MGGKETLEQWEDRTLSSIFRITLDPERKADAHGARLHFAEGVRAELEQQSEPIRLSVQPGNVDAAILEAASSSSTKKPLDYLLACWKRVSRMFRSMRSSQESEEKMKVVKEARRLCMSNCIFAATMPDMFGQDTTDTHPLAEYLLSDPEDDRGLCHDFLSEAVSRFQEDELARDALVGAVEQLSRDLSKKSMNEDFRPYVLALRNLVRYPAIVEGLTQSTHFLPESVPAEKIEDDTLLGPFFHLSPLQGPVARQYFAGTQARDDRIIAQSQNSLRMVLATHQDDLFDIANCIIKANKDSREKMLDWLALTVNANHKRRAMQVDSKTVSSDGFMINVTIVLDRLCEPFMDATFSKLDRIDVDYLRRKPRVIIQDETKMNADQATSDRFYSEEVAGTSNFISEIFFLTVAAHHYGTEAANTRMSSLQRELKYLREHIQKFKDERPKFEHNPPQLAMFERHLKKYEDQAEEAQGILHATRGVLLDETCQRRSMSFMRYVIVWLIKLASQSNYPAQPLQLPLPEEQPEVFKCLPEYFLEDVVDNFKFITRWMPHVVVSTQCEELITVCVTFLRSSEYVKNPGVKSGLVTILFHGVWPIRSRNKGVLGDQLNGSEFCYKHLLHALMKFFIEAENTGTHSQFYDKFNIRYEIFQVIRCIWSNTIYRENLAKEAR